MNKINILLPVEIIARELDYKLFFAADFASKNVNVIIAQHDYFKSHCSQFSGGIYIGKNCFTKPFLEGEEDYTEYKACIKELNENNITILYMDEEGAIWPGSEPEWKLHIDGRFNPKFLNDQDYIFAWGDYQKKHYESKNSPVPESNIISSGHPKYDLYKPRFRKFFQKEIDEIKEEFGSFVLINTNFYYGNPLNGLKSRFTDLGEGWDSYTVRDDQARMKFVNLWKHEHKILSNFVALIHRLSIVYPEKKFILRPHPGENPETYRMLFSDVENVNIVKKGAVSSWILASDLLIHDGCTTAVESYMAEVPIINYKSEKNPLYDIDLPNQLGVRCENEQEVIEAINKLDEEPKSFVKTNSLSEISLSIFKNLHSDTYDDFMVLCKKLINEKLERSAGTGEISCGKMAVREWKHSIVLFLKSLVRIFFPVRLRNYRDARAVFPGFDENFVREKIAVAGEMLQKEVSVKYLSDRLLVVTGEKKEG